MNNRLRRGLIALAGVTWSRFPVRTNKETERLGSAFDRVYSGNGFEISIMEVPVGMETRRNPEALAKPQGSRGSQIAPPPRLRVSASSCLRPPLARRERAGMRGKGRITQARKLTWNADGTPEFGVPLTLETVLEKPAR